MLKLRGVSARVRDQVYQIKRLLEVSVMVRAYVCDEIW